MTEMSLPSYIVFIMNIHILFLHTHLTFFSIKQLTIILLSINFLSLFLLFFPLNKTY